MTSPLFVGVDVAKERLDVVVRPGGEGWSVANDEAGIAALVARLRPLGPALIVCEATGGFERAALAETKILASPAVRPVPNWSPCAWAETGVAVPMESAGHAKSGKCTSGNPEN